MDHPFLDPAFHPPWGRFTASCIEPDMEAALQRAQKRLDAIAAQDLDSLTYRSVLQALENATDELERAWTYVSHLDSVNNSQELRQAYNAVLPRVTDFFTRIPLNEDLWRVLEAYSKTQDAAALDPVRARFLEEVLDDFRDNGADLNPEQKSELEQINAELAALTQKYSENVLDGTNAWEKLIDDASLLEGLPESALQAARHNAQQKGHGSEAQPVYRITLQFTSFLPVLQYAHNNALRQEVWEATSCIGATEAHDNRSLVPRILQLRQQKAELLGHPHFADFVLKRRMAANGSNALAFVENLHARVVEKFTEDNTALENYRAEKTGQPAARLEPWDLAYWAERMRREHHDFDEEALRPYFPVQGVIAGMFDLVERIFGVTIKEVPAEWLGEGGQPNNTLPPWKQPIETWHEEVKVYQILDTDGTHLGSFYADWHPRETKRGGAWMNTLRTGKLNQDGQLEPHLGLMCGNLTPPIGDTPALLTHREVETVFHEFGHLLHHLLGRVEVPSLNGIHVKWDFVELPSQIMENWCWQRESLDLFARHYQTGETIPETLFNKMLGARSFRAAANTMRQLSFGKLDLELHLHLARGLPEDLEAVLSERIAGYRIPTRTLPPTGIYRFSHLFADPTGYAAGYYSYKWAEVLDADAFTRFQKEGILNAATGRDLREKILARGNSAPPDTLFRDFMGRDPDETALLRRDGLA
ncbi:MAG: M3 family metallopeptidase [Opitutales bacterium]